MAELVDALDLESSFFGSAGSTPVEATYFITRKRINKVVNELKCWITRRYNGLYLVTAFKPVITEVLGAGHEDAYIKYGDPVGYINVPYNFGVNMFDDAPQERVVPYRGILFGQRGDPATHMIEFDEETGLYTIFQDSKTYIPNVCQWFITKMFNIKELYHNQPVTFCGRITSGS